MRTPEDVLEMRRLHGLGWGTRRIAARLGCSRTTVQVWLRRGRWRKAARRRRDGVLTGLEEWLRARLVQHEGNADVVRQELETLGVRVSLRTVQRAVEPFRRELRAAVVATTRFETPPGYQLQIDFGERQVWIGEEKRRVTLFVATLGCSRRMHVRVFLGERQGHWFEGLESTFAEFGGVPETVLLDNARTLVKRHDAATREVVFQDRFLAFAKHCGTTGRVPIEQFVEEEAQQLQPLPTYGRFEQVRELTRRVTTDCSVVVDTNAYSVPWRLIGERVRVLVSATKVCIHHGASEVAAHPRSPRRRQRITEAAHFVGVAGAEGRAVRRPRALEESGSDSLQRPLEEYAEIAGGSW
ncbi:MAG: IS21 family transposase [Gemmatimonadetes bacterium]|nr:IS21 family transposase [Gemmatimonadota bacterium]MYE91930.1 IS21 family transposase [Gemmatimonadota bacterium]